MAEPLDPEEFDPVAFAERWYEENPWAWERYSQALARKSKEEPDAEEES